MPLLSGGVEISFRSLIAVSLGSAWCISFWTRDLIAPRLLIPVVALVSVSPTLGQSLVVLTVVPASSLVAGLSAAAWGAVFGLSEVSRAIGLLLLVVLLVFVVTNDLANKIGIAVLAIVLLTPSSQDDDLLGLVVQVVGSTLLGGCMGTLAMLPGKTPSYHVLTESIRTSCDMSVRSLACTVRALATHGQPWNRGGRVEARAPYLDVSTGAEGHARNGGVDVELGYIDSSGQGPPGCVPDHRQGPSYNPPADELEPLVYSVKAGIQQLAQHMDFHPSSRYYADILCHYALSAAGEAFELQGPVLAEHRLHAAVGCLWCCGCVQYSCQCCSDQICCCCGDTCQCCGVCSGPPDLGPALQSHVDATTRLARIAGLASAAEKAFGRSDTHHVFGRSLQDAMLHVVYLAGSVQAIALRQLSIEHSTNPLTCWMRWVQWIVCCTQCCANARVGDMKSVQAGMRDLSAAQTRLLQAFGAARNHHLLYIAAETPTFGIRSDTYVSGNTANDQDQLACKSHPDGGVCNMNDDRTAGRCPSAHSSAADAARLSGASSFDSMMPLYTVVFLVIRFAQVCESLPGLVLPAQDMQQQTSQRLDGLDSGTQTPIPYSPSFKPRMFESGHARPAVSPEDAVQGTRGLVDEHPPARAVAVGTTHQSATPAAAAAAGITRQEPVNGLSRHDKGVPAPCCASLACLLSAWASVSAVEWTSYWPRLRRAVKVGIAVVLASTIVIIPAFSRPFGYWAPITVGFIVGTNSASSFYQSLLRFVGTALGSIAGYFIVSVAENAVIVYAVLLCFWCALSVCVRPSRRYGYAGLVSAFTAGIIVLGDRPPGVAPHSVALARIEVTVFAIAVFLLVSNVVFPYRPLEQAATQSSAALSMIETGLRAATAQLCDGFRDYCKTYMPVSMIDGNQSSAADGQSHKAATTSAGSIVQSASHASPALSAGTAMRMRRTIDLYLRLGNVRFCDMYVLEAYSRTDFRSEYRDTGRERDGLLMYAGRNVALAKQEPFRKPDDSYMRLQSAVIAACSRISVSIRLLRQGARFLAVLQAARNRSGMAPSRLLPVVPWVQHMGQSTAELLHCISRVLSLRARSQLEYCTGDCLWRQPLAVRQREHSDGDARLTAAIDACLRSMVEFKAVLDSFISNVLLPMVRDREQTGPTHSSGSASPSDSLPVRSGEIIVISAALFGLDLAANDAIQLGNAVASTTE